MDDRMYTHALLLNADYRPLRILTWERAIYLLLDEKADLVTGYAGDLIRSAHVAWNKPAVVRLRKYVQVQGRVRFSRANVLARDGYRCAYCGEAPTRAGRPDLEALTLDHVVPRAQSRDGKVRLPSGKVVSVTTWENIVTACMPCNGAKADRTPAQAGMRLRHQPRVPTPGDVLRMSLRRVVIPDEWKAYLPDGAAGWGDYWDGELDPE